MRVIRTATLRLEPLIAKHAREMFPVLADPAIYEFEGSPPASERWLFDRYARLETRCSEDGTAAWLNWVIRLPSGHLAGYVQATILERGAALIAYELSSRYWRQGIGSTAVSAMLRELHMHYAVDQYVAILKARNYRSHAFLQKLGFYPAGAGEVRAYTLEPDEILMTMEAAALLPSLSKLSR